MVSRRNLRLRRVHGDGPFVSVPVFLVPTVEKTGGQTQKDRPLVYKQISNSLSTSNGGVSGGLILGAGVLLWRRRMRWHNALTQCG